MRTISAWSPSLSLYTRGFRMEGSVASNLLFTKRNVCELVVAVMPCL